MEKDIKVRLIVAASVVVMTVFSMSLYYSGINFRDPLLLLFLVIPALIIILGKLSDLIVENFNITVSRTLIFNDFTFILPLFFYYLVLSIFMSFLIENSLIFSNFDLEELEIALIALSLAYLPRVIGFTAAHERTRALLLSILTPLTTLSLPVLFLKSEDITFTVEVIWYCILGSLVFPFVGDLWIMGTRKAGILVKYPEYQRPDFLKGIKAKPYEQNWDRFAEDFNDPYFEEYRNTIIKAFIIGAEEAKNSVDLAESIISALKNVDYSIEISSRFFDVWKELAKDEKWTVRMTVAKALEEIGKVKPDEVLPILKEWAKDENETVREAAKDALQIIQSR